MKTVILHVCCAPCSTHCIEELKNNNYKPILFFHNPNIYPKSEYEKRLDEVKKYAKKTKTKLIVGPYNKDDWNKFIEGLEDESEGGKRCTKCFEFRLLETAKQTKKEKEFTTSLTVSPYKDSKVIIPLGKKIAKDNGIIFLEFDFKKKDGYKKSIKLSQQNALYRQNYCGCKYSL